MATLRPWPRPIELVRASEPLDRQMCFAQLVDGRILLPRLQTNELDSVVCHRPQSTQRPYFSGSEPALVDRRNPLPFQHLSCIPNHTLMAPPDRTRPRSTTA